MAAPLTAQPLPTLEKKHVIVINKATYGPPGDPKRTRQVREKLQTLIDRDGARLLVANVSIGDDPAPRMEKTLEADYTIDGRPHHASGQDHETLDLLETLPDDYAAERVAEVHFAADGKLRLTAWKAGQYELKTSSGRTLSCPVASVPEPQEIAGPWELKFPPGGGATQDVTLPKLVSWSEHGEPGVKYFSGTAVYRKVFALPAAMHSPQSKIFLDLGNVQVIAGVKLNGRDLGILWKPPYRLDITAAVKPGLNRLVVGVTNLWINRMIGDEQLPEDSDRNKNGTLKAWPQWLDEGKPSPTGRHTFTSWRLWKKDSPLQPSGLLGPVTLQAAVETAVH